MGTQSMFRFTTAVILAASATIAGASPADAGESKEEMALKHRSAIPKDSDFDRSVSLQSLLDKHDKTSWSSSKAATLEGVLVQLETEADGDLHVVLAPSGKEHDTRSWVITEVPAALQKQHARLSQDSLAKFKGKKVSVSGWLYYEPDDEHTDPRGTMWEIHPITDVVLAKN